MKPSPTKPQERQHSTGDRFLPGLLERLTDKDPHSERPLDRVVSFPQYREDVRRNLEWILTSSGHLPDEAISQFPEVRSSVLNMGVQQFCGETDTGLDLERLRLRIIEAIKFFEPRLETKNLEVTVEADRNLVTIQIRGALWARPAPEHFSAKTSIDIETGRCEFEDTRHG